MVGQLSLSEQWKYREVGKGGVTMKYRENNTVTFGKTPVVRTPTKQAVLDQASKGLERGVVCVL